MALYSEFDSVDQCYAKAVEYWNADTGPIVAGLLDGICSSPSVSSDSKAYIDAHRVEYRQLLYYDDYTLRCVFAEFLKGGQAGLKGHIMLAAVTELIGSEDALIEAGTPQEWFDSWKDRALQTRRDSSIDYMLEQTPKAYISLRMMELAQPRGLGTPHGLRPWGLRGQPH